MQHGGEEAGATSYFCFIKLIMKKKMNNMKWLTNLTFNYEGVDDLCSKNLVPLFMIGISYYFQCL